MSSPNVKVALNTVSVSSHVSTKWYQPNHETLKWLGWSLVFIMALWAVLTGYFTALLEAGLAVRGTNYLVLKEGDIKLDEVPSYSDQPALPWTLIVPLTTG